MLYHVTRTICFSPSYYNLTFHAARTLVALVLILSERIFTSLIWLADRFPDMVRYKFSPIMPNSVQRVSDFLRESQPFFYWPNDGNIGDLLIAVATRQFFRREKLSYKEWDASSSVQPRPSTLVYGGGGRFVPHWGSLDSFVETMTAPWVQRCIILPHSIRHVDAFVQSFDERFTVFCRDAETLNYVSFLNPRVQCIPADDMAMQYRLEEQWCEVAHTDQGRRDEMEGNALLERGFASEVEKMVRRSSSTIQWEGAHHRVAFILRRDKEKLSSAESPFSCDPNSRWYTHCLEASCNTPILSAIFRALDYPDSIVTDRLHVAVMGCLLGKQVYMLDNDYGKLGGVYRQTLRRFGNVHYVGNNVWPEPVSAAWRKLNSPMKLFIHRLFGC